MGLIAEVRDEKDLAKKIIEVMTNREKYINMLKLKLRLSPFIFLLFQKIFLILKKMIHLKF